MNEVFKIVIHPTVQVKNISRMPFYHQDVVKSIALGLGRMSATLFPLGELGLGEMGQSQYLTYHKR